MKRIGLLRQLHRKCSESERNPHQRRRPRAVFQEEDFEADIGLRSLDRSGEAVGLNSLVGDLDGLRSGELQADLILRPEENGLRRWNASLAEFVTGVIQER